ncbi:uncharacterized protein TNCV_1791531 [Trichonephila clavipes]|nr:uncharacterized protein TNCV_1791531 [Trichonephila clavipes]
MGGTEKNNRSKIEKGKEFNVYSSSDCEVKVKAGLCEGSVKAVAMGAQRGNLRKSQLYFKLPPDRSSYLRMINAKKKERFLPDPGTIVLRQKDINLVTGKPFRIKTCCSSQMLINSLREDTEYLLDLGVNGMGQSNRSLPVVWKEQRGIVGQQIDFVLKWLSRVGLEVGPTKELCEGDTMNRWRDEQVCPDVGQGTMAPWARRPGCVLACYAQIRRGGPRNFCDLPIRRDEGRVVNTPLVFKMVLFQERRGRRDGEEKRKETEKEKKESRETERSRHWMEKWLSSRLEWKDDERRWR